MFLYIERWFVCLFLTSALTTCFVRTLRRVCVVVLYDVTNVTVCIQRNIVDVHVIILKITYNENRWKHFCGWDSEGFLSGGSNVENQFSKFSRPISSKRPVDQETH